MTTSPARKNVFPHVDSIIALTNRAVLASPYGALHNQIVPAVPAVELERRKPATVPGQPKRRRAKRPAGRVIGGRQETAPASLIAGRQGFQCESMFGPIPLYAIYRFVSAFGPRLPR
ncbi:MAG: hypothetical protein C0629_15395 [Chromatiales bacterium]|nr:MAG: hypothetical protein C0629_15395 [Chromatiales bacterium]